MNNLKELFDKHPVLSYMTLFAWMIVLAAMLRCI